MAKILIVDDDELLCQLLAKVVASLGHDPAVAFTLGEGRRMSRETPFDVVLLDVSMPDGNGLEELPAFKQSPGNPEVIIITGDGDPDGAVLAIKNGAWDYIQKPASIERMKLPLVRALQFRSERQARQAPLALKREGIIGESRAIRQSLDSLAQAAASEANVLITGETGTGKELFAWAVHANSARRDKPFVVVDCGALPSTLVENLLFGHERGSFTGAERSQEGLVGQADGGTLFLDEVGELPAEVQTSFLRVLQERRYRPLGGSEEVTSDFRLVATTNRDLDVRLESGQFRSDLLFRLRSIHIDLPPLREREGDVRDLAMHYLARLSEHLGTGAKGMSPEFLHALTVYDWPGNVRELVNTMERVLTAARQEPVLHPQHLPTYVRARLARASLSIPERETKPADRPAAPLAPRDAPLDRADGELPSLKEFREQAVSQAERDYLHELLNRAQGKIPQASEIAGLSRARLYALLKKHGITTRG